MLVRKHYLFYGRVQGVGFRFTAYHKAVELGLTGWVCNLPDGSVEACFQGEESLIERLVSEMKHTRFICIDSMKVENLTILKDETSFEMKY